MDATYKNCSALDKLGDEHTFYRLTFSENWIHNPFMDWASTVAPGIIERIAKTPYLLPAQGAPTILVSETVGGDVCVIDVIPHAEWSGAILSTALEAIDDALSGASLVSCEKIGTITDADQSDAQIQAAGAAQKKAITNSPTNNIIGEVESFLVLLAVGVVVSLIVYQIVKKKAGV